jgi:predicted enzyme related to lactoylglutathione lyase
VSDRFITAKKTMNKDKKLAGLLLLISVFSMVAGCTTLNIELPSVTQAPTNARYPGKVIWHDLLTNDIEGSKRFYGGLFGWQFDELPLTLGMGASSKYLLISHQGKLIGGMVDVSNVDKEINSSQWVVLMSVADVDQAVADIKRAGGTVLTPPTDLNERGRIALATDVEGALFAVLETRSGDPLDREPAVGEFMWDEVWTSDVDKAADFYKSVAPFELVDKELGNASYKGLLVDEKPRAGVLLNPAAEQGLKPTWVSYIKVQDMSVLDKVAGLGGQVLLGAENRPIGGQVAIITGPSGAGVVLQTWDDSQED